MHGGWSRADGLPQVIDANAHQTWRAYGRRTCLHASTIWVHNGTKAKEYGFDQLHLFLLHARLCRCRKDRQPAPMHPTKRTAITCTLLFHARLPDCQRARIPGSSCTLSSSLPWLDPDQPPDPTANHLLAVDLPKPRFFTSPSSRLGSFRHQKLPAPRH